MGGLFLVQEHSALNKKIDSIRNNAVIVTSQHYGIIDPTKYNFTNEIP